MAWWYFNDNAKLTLDQRVDLALGKYVGKYSKHPKTLRVWPECPDIAKHIGLDVKREQRIPINCFEME